jgi:hypothetical protein
MEAYRVLNLVKSVDLNLLLRTQGLFHNLCLHVVGFKYYSNQTVQVLPSSAYISLLYRLRSYSIITPDFGNQSLIGTSASFSASCSAPNFKNMSLSLSRTSNISAQSHAEYFLLKSFLSESTQKYSAFFFSNPKSHIYRPAPFSRFRSLHSTRPNSLSTSRFTHCSTLHT